MFQSKACRQKKKREKAATVNANIPLQPPLPLPSPPPLHKRCAAVANPRAAATRARAQSSDRLYAWHKAVPNGSSARARTLCSADLCNIRARRRPGKKKKKRGQSAPAALNTAMSKKFALSPAHTNAALDFERRLARVYSRKKEKRSRARASQI